MTDSAIKYVGVDGCKGGWIGVGLSDGDCWDVHVCKDFADLVACFGDACVILVDIPIGLPEDGKPKLRACDIDARRLLGDLWRSVFEVTSRRFVNEAMRRGWKYRDHTEASAWSRDCMGGGISRQSFGITRKIGEMDEYMRNRDADSPIIREAHPEICFLALNDERRPMSVRKKESSGFWERFKVLRRHVRAVDTIPDIFMAVRRRLKYPKAQVGDDDVLDALALAITAKIGSQEGNELRRLPKDKEAEREGLSPSEFLNLPDMDPPPTDNSEKNLPMEMVYALPNDEGTPC